MAESSPDAARATGSHLLMQCLQCYRTPEQVRVCSLCKNARYCNTDCQKSNWKFHKPFCIARRNFVDKHSKIDRVLPHTVQDLEEFAAVNATAIAAAAMNALGSFRSPPTCDESAFGLFLCIVHEPTRQELPGKRFSLARAFVVPLEQIDTQIPEWALRATREAHLVQAKKRDPGSRVWMTVLMSSHMGYPETSICAGADLGSFSSDPIPNWFGWLQQQFS